MRTGHKIGKSGLFNNVPHIMVIDDDEFLLRVIKKELVWLGYKVTVSNNAEDAQFKLNIIEPDVILLDIIMPEINGIEFMAAINSGMITSNIPIILISSYPKDKLYEMGYNLRCANYLTKPFETNQLRKMIKKILEKAYLTDFEEY